jgi:hypothetical protein
MAYPSLLFSGSASGQTVAKSVFEDVKLTLFFSQEAIDAMRVLCPAGDIPVRQALVRYLLEAPDCREHFARLAEITAHIHRLREALADVKCENERHYIFVCLIAAVTDFYQQAAAGPQEGGLLLKRFTDWFRSAAEEPERKAMAARALELRRQAEEAQRMSFRTSGDNLWLRLEYGESYVERLQRCARDLGLPPTRMQRDTMIRLDARMVNALARLHPEAFLAFEAFYGEYGQVFDESTLSYRYELNFYLEAVRLLDRIRSAGLPLCWPHISREKQILIRGLRDVSLLHKETDIIPNDAEFTQAEPFFFLTGANGGGKTTFLRSLGISALLFLSGCPICADDADFWPPENVFTHFPQDERFEADGRFADEQRRVGEILAKHNGSSLILLNETYSTTNEELAVSCTLELAEKLKNSGSFVLYITHQHGLEAAEVPFLSVIVDEGDDNRRTYRIARRKEAAGSYAADILRRYSLDREGLRRRFAARPAGKEAQA